ncbi:ADP-ribosylglycohydrolase family protein [Flagellimonas sp. 389]|uniref:ADP-ribosylglycohydrolase family protein n=1 Tax=Flagellimonas sp. 389 TaxID=2835862 RepID=UPI001BD25E8F|nr:ADP-ribosylglycohydrolase family protein [Flagellimonas sp. 389]MBS9462581.1 ADP-ribosylglycohydrolase family protein [Flagellimonas sp. 389]
MKKTLEYANYIDKIRGGWVGKCAGGILGAPIEGYKKFNSIELNDTLFESNFANDDLDLQLLWLDMVLKKGAQVRESDFKEHWINHVAFPWNEYGIATRNIRLGLDNPDSGSHNNDYWKHSMGSPIRSEIWGMLCAANPEKAAFYAKMDSTLDHEGFSVEAEQYLSACTAIAFVEDDMFTILTRALEFIPKQGLCARLIRAVIFWNREYGATIASKKIKSLYGDADFTSAPMNTGFTILSLLNSEGNLDNLNTALHYGHDSDCVIATAGALMGVITGFEALPETWKNRVGDEILVSPEITGINCPSTITQLTGLTCSAAKPFLDLNPDFEILDFPIGKSTTKIPLKEYALHSSVKEYPRLRLHKLGLLTLTIENFKDSLLLLEIHIKSEFFENFSEKITVSAGQIECIDVRLVCKIDAFPTKPSLTYTIEVDSGTEKRIFEKGMPNYGKWLLLGPFIEDDSSLIPMDEKYPDHGMSSLPSVTYMNHDAQRPTTEFINQEAIDSILESDDFKKVPYGCKLIFPKSMEIDLGDYFYGKGERTLYLYTQIESSENTKKWLCLGHSNYCTVWLNSKKLHATGTSKRRWPGTEAVELQLNKGTNGLLLRFDFINDDFLVNIGLKEHKEKHPHQSQWDTELLFNIQDLHHD